MRNESYKRSMKTITGRRETALREAEERTTKVCFQVPRIREIQNQLQQTGGKIVKAVFSKQDSRTQIEQIMLDNIRLQQEQSQLLEASGYPADYLEVEYFCRFCEDTGYRQGHQCECLKKLIAENNALEFNRGSSLSLASFDSFSLDYYPEEGALHAPSSRRIMAEILEFCQTYAARFHQNAPSVLMMGDTGLGKTHLSLAIAGAIMKRGYTVLYVSAPDLFRKLQNEYYGRGDQGISMMDTILAADLVIIDDLGAEIENQFNTASLYNIVNTKLNAKQPVIINTNLVPKELERRYSSRVASRLMTMYQCLKFVGKDVRLIKLKNGES